MSNFYERIAGAASTFPQRTAVESIGESGSRSLTYAALITDAERVATWLRSAANIHPGDRVALLAANDVRWVTAFAAALRCGAVVVPLDTGYSSQQVQTILTDSGARLLLAGERFLDVATSAARGIADNAPRVVPLTGLPHDAADVDVATPSIPPSPRSDSDAAVLLYTSGTTADPKGVVLTHGNLDAERTAVLSVVQATHHDVVLGVLPLFHALAQMANLWLPLTIGASVVFLETVSSSTLLHALQTRGITILACVPQFFYLIHQRVMAEISGRGAIVRRLIQALVAGNAFSRDHFGWNPGRYLFRRVHHALGPDMRLLITGGSRFDPAIARDLYGFGVSLYNGYGLTETSGAATIVRPGDRFTTSVGPALPGVEVKIAERSPSDTRVTGVDAEAVDHDGEVLIRGPILMREYFHRPDATSEVIRDGWLYTGDLGRLDADGRLYITGRKKEVIVLSSGKNIYPEEIEAHYRQSPFVKEICVLGLSRDLEPSAERLHAVVVPNEALLRERGIVNLRELIRFELEGLSVRLPPHKRVLGYDIALEPLARTTTGKLRRREIEALARARASAPVTERPATERERGWLAEGSHAEDVAQIGMILGRPGVTPDANLELDLGLDSMERIELLTTLETQRGRRVAPVVRATIFTVRELVEALEHADEAAGGSADVGLPWDVVLSETADPELVRNLTKPKLIRALVIYGALRVAAAAAGLALGLRVTGRRHIPRDGAVIVSPNHQTYVDGFFVASALPFRVFRRIFFVGAAEYFETPMMAWGARAINIVPVDPDANLVSAMRAAATGLRLGKVLMLFPEGERTIDGTLKPFRKGVAILGSHLNVPVVPVALHGFFPWWPRGRAFQWRRIVARDNRRTSVEFGTPVHIPAGDYAAGALMLQTQVAEMIARVSR